MRLATVIIYIDKLLRFFSTLASHSVIAPTWASLPFVLLRVFPEALHPPKHFQAGKKGIYSPARQLSYAR